MSVLQSNPFLSLYVTDSPDPRVFVELFSDVLIPQAQPLFEPGNVVLRGTQGSGKSMLLNLLTPSIRKEYERAEQPFPIKGKHANFVGAGINLSLSGILDIGQRPIKDHENETVLFPILFGDFLNYYVFRDLLRSLETIGTNAQEFQEIVSQSALDAFAIDVSKYECWFGYLAGVEDFHSLKRRVDTRLASYRSFHQYNGDLDSSINDTKTAIGVPLNVTVDCLRRTNVIEKSTPVFIRIDQIERLYRSDILRPDLGKSYRRVINKALGSRDSRVSYRIGTRQYAWDDDVVMFGTDDRLEEIRDYRVLDLDKTLRRQEDTSTWIFPDFAADVFGRRLLAAEVLSDASLDNKTVLKTVLGTTDPPSVSAVNYVGKSSAKRALRIEDRWPKPWKEFLTEIFDEDPLSAIYASAWARQKGPSSKDRLSEPPPDSAPWEKSTWKSERTRQALLQLASRCAQRLKWSGHESVTALSAGNVSIFLSICYEIWDSFLRAERRKNDEGERDPLESPVPAKIQAVGIRSASDHWFQKISERPRGHDRQRFIEVLGRKFRTWLGNDAAMSYPGHNGFSLTLEELETEPEIKAFLNESVDYGDLYDAPHTTNRKDRKARRKWYLAPIVSVYFQIPEAHKKEPYYAKVSEVKAWMREAGIEVDSGQLRFAFLAEGDAEQ